ncbi:MAG: hypothetical protein AAFV72_19820 [Cyanobacteria bacterium J06635_1]
MKRFVLSSLSLLLAAGAIAPVANAQDIAEDFNLHEVRIENFDSRQKSDASLVNTTIHARRLEQERSKSDASLVNTTIHARRLEQERSK